MKFELRWPGKEALPALVSTPGAGLKPVEIHGPQRDPNLLIRGDNLRVAASLRPRFEGKIDLVYLDPPFATGERFSLSAALGDTTRVAAEIDAYDDRLDDPGEFIAALAPRLALARALLSPQGILFLHLDARASHAAKLLLDELFGPGAFRGELIWLPGNGAKARSFFSLQHQSILAYSRGSQWVFNGDDPALREPFAEGSLKSHFRNTDAEGRKFRRRVVNGKEYIYYADQGRRIGSVWSDLPAMAAGSPIVGESTGYPTQKPEKLLERILLACSRPGDLVADLCCGSGTTLAAAERLGRRWIGCDVGALAVHTARKRLLSIPSVRPFAILQHPSVAPSPSPSADVVVDGEQVILHNFHTPVENLPPALRGGGEDLLDAWSVGRTLDDGSFEGLWHAHRSRKQRAMPLRSPPLALPEQAAVVLHDVLGRRSVLPLPGR